MELQVVIQLQKMLIFCIIHFVHLYTGDSFYLKYSQSDLNQINRTLEMMDLQKNPTNRQVESQQKDELRRGRWRREKLSGPSIFIAKTFEILESDQHSGIISWSQDGTHFTILDVERFENEILPAYFRHRNFSSFVRQLNMYDFHKIRNEQNKNIFEHREFRRNSRQLLRNIRRKGCTNRKGNDQQDELVYEQETPDERFDDASQKQDIFRATLDSIEHNSQRVIPAKSVENLQKAHLIEELIASLPDVVESESEVHEIIRGMKRDCKYKCLNSKEDVRKIVHKIRMNKMKRDDEDLDELSIEEEIMVQNVDDRDYRYPTLAVLTSENYLPHRTLPPLICSLVLCDDATFNKH